MEKRTLGLGAATALVAGEVIGVGIFLTPAEMTKALGSPFWVLMVWLAVGTGVFCGSLCYGVLAARYPEAGGGYVYLREAWGPGVAFLYGWKSLIIMDPGLTAALATGVASYAAVLVPLDTLGQKAVAMGTILFIALVSALGVRFAGNMMWLLTGVKLLLLGTIIVWGFASSHGSWSNFEPFVDQRPGSSPLLAGLASGLIGAFFSFGGFWDVAKIGGDIRNPVRTLPRALALGVGIATIVYVLTSVAFIYLVPIETVGSGTAFAAQAGVALFGAEGGHVFAAIVLISIAGSLAAVQMTAPRVYYAMARDGLFLRSVGQLHPRFGTPVRAIAIQAILGCVMVALATFGAIIAYFIFVTTAFVALTVAGIWRLPRPAGETFRAPGHHTILVVFLALLVTMLALLAMARPFETALGTGVVMLGYVFYRAVVLPRKQPHKI